MVYASQDGSPAPAPDTFKIDVNVVAPTAQLNPKHSTIQFGPWQTGSYTDAKHTQWIANNTPLAWDDPGFAANNAQTAWTNPATYGFGFTAPGLDGNTWWATVNNTTPATGQFYFDQVVTINYTDVLENPVTNTKQTYSLATGSTPKLDEYSNDAAGPAWAGKGGSVTLRAGAGPITIPADGTVMDVNGQPLDATWDNPHSLELPSQTNPLVLVSQKWSLQLATSVIFQASGGIPIAIATDTWSINVNESNPTAAANPTFANAYLNKNNWVGSATQTPGTVTTTPSLIQWSGNGPSDLAAANKNPVVTPLNPNLAPAPNPGPPAPIPGDGLQSPQVSTTAAAPGRTPSSPSPRPTTSPPPSRSV